MSKATLNKNTLNKNAKEFKPNNTVVENKQAKAQKKAKKKGKKKAQSPSTNLRPDAPEFVFPSSTSPTISDPPLPKADPPASPSPVESHSPKTNGVQFKKEESPTPTLSPRKYTRAEMVTLRKPQYSNPDIIAAIERVLGEKYKRPRGTPARVPNNNGRAKGFVRGGGNARKAFPPELFMPVAPLERTDNGYVVKRDHTRDEKVLRAMQSILNKLTPENFSKLLGQVLELEIDSSDLLTECVNCVFEKALAEPAFSPTYAQFCVELATGLPQFEDQHVAFKRLLLNKCQEEFEEKGYESEPNKKRYLATIRFIGELYARKLISKRIVKYCITDLRCTLDTIEEEKMEALCKLLFTVGKLLDGAENAFMADLYDKLKEYVRDGHLSSRYRFMLQDAIDLRKNDWVVRRKETISQQKISAIRVTKPVQSKPARLRSPPTSPSKHSNKRGDRHGRQQSPLQQSPRKGGGKDDWETATKRKGARGGNNRFPPFGSQDVRKDLHNNAGRHGGGGKSKNYRKEQKADQKAPVSPGDRSLVRASQSNRFTGFGDDGDDDDDEPETPESQEDQEDQEGKESDRLDSDRDSLSNGDLDAEEKMITKIDSILKEFFSNEDITEATLCVVELRAPEYYHLVVSRGLALVSEGRERDRDLFPKLAQNLFSENVLPAKDFENGFIEVLEFAEDTLIDVPLFLRHTGTILGLLIAGCVMNLSFLTSKHVNKYLKGENLKEFCVNALTAMKNEVCDEEWRKRLGGSNISPQLLALLGVEV